MADEKKPQLTHAERIFVRISALQTVLAVAGVFTGSVALYAALNEADAVRKQQQAAVWPYVGIGSMDLDLETGAEIFQRVALNSGIGPARIAAFRVTVDGASQKTWKEAVAALTGDRNIPVVTGSISGRVIRPGEMIEMVTVRGDAAAAINSAHSRLRVEACYCSVFDSCWLVDTSRRDAIFEPEPVRRCPDYGAEQFTQ
ncbi:hypothetical protein [Amphiplicatus metriothermophilus]|uniref:Uncharacterized protein n=1 Tax=Amphiplicatus metriothermophilus TaxID=1519374 RepID=A0A239PKC4_9PROT|nr:hypothetical protein [Amphiplicatus metriothermophilus]MBB5517893.1 hypothetical protein [Amphiplicatus metriothermophilus]SNT67773.1 hypothetical protein SAMN06297382_0266 [Amphiplicatus metriothermophilus]